VADEYLRDLAGRLQEICLAKGLTVGVAESCTGGRIGDALTDIAGSSGYFRGGVVVYADALKADILGVPTGLIAQHGAVSAQVARAMASGVRERLAVDLGAAVTGIAGPSGAAPGKPVGLTYVGVADADGIEIRRFTWPGDRAANKAASARATLELLVERAAAIAARDTPETSDPDAPAAPVAGPGRAT
jgi:PncC family amidohydrolase